MSAGTTVLTVNALDTRGEEGIVPDVGVIAELDARPACVATGFVAGGAPGPVAFHPVPLDLIERQVAAVLADGTPAAARVGLVRGADHVTRLAAGLGPALAGRIVVAPVVRMGGAILLDDATREAIVSALFPLGRVVVVRAADLTAFGAPAAEDVPTARAAAEALRAAGARAALVAGLPVRGRIVDVLDDGGRVSLLDAARIQAPRIAGLAGAHAAALATHFGRGAELGPAAEAAQRYVALRLQRRR